MDALSRRKVIRVPARSPGCWAAFEGTIGIPASSAGGSAVTGRHLQQGGDSVRERALVIGGSRGLGELTAKILMVGGADVTITYALGGDVERVADEARSGRRCSTMHWMSA
jgi:hypothetical protein